MSEKIYVVTLKRKEDLEDFYSEMSANGFRLHLKRPLSRNTHYYMTEEQAETLRQDDRVVDVQLTPEELGWKPIRLANNYPPSLNSQMDETTIQLWKSGSGNQLVTNWGFLQHCDVFSPSENGTPGQYAYTFTGDLIAGINVITNVSGTTPAATPQGNPVIETRICKVEYNENSTGATLRTDHDTYIDRIVGSTIYLSRPILGSGSASGVTIELFRYDRQRDTFGASATQTATDDINFYSYGRHVDVVICDDPVSWNNGEWWSSQAGPEDYILPGYSDVGNIEPQGATDSSRFVDYQWFNELNGYVSSIDDDSQTLPTGQITRYDVATNPRHHGNHVTGTVAGRYYGWAKAANIYECQVLGAMQSGQTMPVLLLFDYLRAFHRYKPINPATGFRNPTITNHSWGYAYDLSDTFPSGFALSNIVQIQYRGTNYSASNPGPSGWTLEGIETDFGIGRSKTVLPSDYAALRADIEDAIEDGVVVIGAAGNENFYSVPEIDPETQATHVDWNNGVTLNVLGSNVGHFYNRGMSPCNAKGAINVGAMSNNEDFRRASFTNYGPRVDVFAAGQNILSSWNASNPGVIDPKYQNTPSIGDRYYPISGTSMASPQVCGIAACLASGKERFTNADLLGFINRHADSLMRFDTAALGVALLPTTPSTYDITVTAPDSSRYTLSGTDRDGSVSGDNASVSLIVGDTVNFNMSNVSAMHPFRLRDSSGGPDVSTPAATGQGSTGNATCSWTPNTAGTYVYQCSNHGGMLGTITVQAATPSGIQAGSFGDYTCSQGSPNKQIRFGFDRWIGKPVAGSNGEAAEGVGNEIKGKRLPDTVTNQTFPRRNTLFRSWDHA